MNGYSPLAHSTLHDQVHHKLQILNLLFEKALVFDISFMVIIFWFILGQIMCYNVREKEEPLKEFSFKESVRKNLL